MNNQKKNEEPKIGEILTESIKWIRETILKWKKKKWDYVESLIEKIKQINAQEYNKSKKIKNKKGPGRPKKEVSLDANQKKIDLYMDIEN